MFVSLYLPASLSLRNGGLVCGVPGEVETGHGTAGVRSLGSLSGRLHLQQIRAQCEEYIAETQVSTQAAGR